AKAGGEWRVDPCGIIATWAVRPESSEQWARRMVKTLDALSEASPLLSGWLVSERYPYELAYEDQHTMPFAVARDKMKEIVEACAWGAREALGYNLGAAVSDIASSRFMEFSASAGGHDEHGPGFRCARLWTNRFADADPELVTAPLFKAALFALVEAWEPEFAIAESFSLARYSGEKSAPFAPAWMTYLSAPLARQIVPPSGVRVERDDAGGILMIATEEKFDVENPEHMAAAKRICAAVASIDMDMPVFRNARVEIQEGKA
ncbi:MAG TPA: Imm52 family immunity protein, partial [Elusimicrobiota bacterium]|nr:Imm52 family immunity protein [Elusimicrobiota bacterium]